MYLVYQPPKWGDFLTLGQAALWFHRSVQWVTTRRDLLDLGYSHRLYHLRTLQSYDFSLRHGYDAATRHRFQIAALAEFYGLPREIAPDEADHIHRIKVHFGLIEPIRYPPGVFGPAFWRALHRVWKWIASLGNRCRRIISRWKTRPPLGRSPPCHTNSPYQNWGWRGAPPPEPKPTPRAPAFLAEPDWYLRVYDEYAW